MNVLNSPETTPATVITNSSNCTQGNVTNTPISTTNSGTFLQNLTHTGWTVRVPLPLGADFGPVPLFAYRVSPICTIPNLRCGDKWPVFNPGEDENVLYRCMDHDDLYTLNVRVYNDCVAYATGVESPQSLFTKLFKFHRADMVYNLRFSGNYNGSGLIQIVPMKHLPRGTVPLATSLLGGQAASGMMNNSNVIADFTKSREIKFVYPYEYDTEFQDFSRDIYLKDGYSPYKSYPSSECVDKDNWFVVMARGSFSSATQQHFDVYIDHALAQYDVQIPMMPYLGCIVPPITYSVVSDAADETKQYFKYQAIEDQLGVRYRTHNVKTKKKPTHEELASLFK